MAELNFDSTKVYVAAGTDGIADHLEINGSPFIEVFRVESTNSSDHFFCRKIAKVMSIEIQNHGANFGAGVVRDNPKVTVDDTTGTGGAKITIDHTGTQEVFTVAIYGSTG